MWESFYDLLNSIRASESRLWLDLLLAQARQQFTGARLEYLEREIEHRLARVAARPGRESAPRIDEAPPPA